jgi:hypothetical protein
MEFKKRPMALARLVALAAYWGVNQAKKWALIWANRCQNSDMSNDAQREKIISIYSAKGYRMIKYIFIRTLKPVRKKRLFLNNTEVR